ncbi:unnamed protein product [Adineta steineri]|uniref:Ribosomal RNA-processing protein 14/surfeit locus protein 6 C-terminal domain-containing protein n=1 Tax=Adineta steineri TaxID=433720 RepID=A0A818VZ50_9BILA|nr:unnamed protein product [Adineta steineri]
MTDTDIKTSDVNTTKDDAIHRHPEIEHFLNLNTILHSLVDFIRPETYIAQDELQTYNELKDKFLRESTSKRNKQQQNKGQTSKSPLEIAGVQSIRTTSGIYRFLAHHHKNHPANKTNKKKPITSVSREELLKKLHDKMPHRQQQQQTENGIDHAAKRKRTKEKTEDRTKRPRTTTKEWTATPLNTADAKASKPQPSTVPTHITFGRFDFKTDDSVILESKKKKTKKFESKQKKLINTLKKVESEQNEIERLKEENPEEGKELLRAQKFKTALAKAKGEKVKDNVQLLRKSIKKQTQLRQRSAKKWKHNKSEEGKRQKEKQDKRNTNLQKRKDDKKAKIKKRLIKKGRMVNG